MTSVAAQTKTSASRSFIQWVRRYWYAAFVGIYGLWVFFPFLAPIFMQIGWSGAGKAIYTIYTFFCHQLPERSFFLFGQKVMYSLGEIQAAWQHTIDPAVLRQFIGNESMGWKVAWSDRMISFYTSIWLSAVVWYPLRRKIKPLAWWGFALLVLPLVIDGGTHAVSDLAGIGQGFRDANQWLVLLTHNAFPNSFYAGDSLGSFNSWMRLITGISAGPAFIWLAFPYFYQLQGYQQELKGLDYDKVIEEIKKRSPHSVS